MTIPASQLVDITSRVIGGGLSGLEFSGTILSKNARLPANTTVPFYSQSAVGDYFGTASDEYKLAGNYFLADSNSSRKPSTLWFYRFVESATAAFLRGIKAPKLDVLKQVTNGGLTIKIDGTDVALSSLSFASATSYSDIATTITSSLSTTGTCTWDSLTQAFVITSATTGADSTIEYATAPASGVDVSGTLGLTAGTLSQGSSAKTLTECMADCVNSNSNFWSFMPLWDETTTEAIELADWCNNQGVRFLYVMVDKSAAATVNPNDDSTLGKQVEDYIGVCPIYNTKELGAMTMGIGAAIDVTQFEGRKTWAYKAQTGLAYTVDDETKSVNLLSNGYNFYGNYATASEQFKLFQNGQCSGAAKWLDTYYGQVYIKDGLQRDWLNIMMNSNTIPYNENGYTRLRASALDTINSAKNAGFIRDGVVLSETQKATVQSQAGLDISTELENQGWYLQILDPTAEVRANRGTPVINFWYCDGGSIQFIQGSSTVIL